MSVTVRLEGFNELARRLERLDKSAFKRIAKVTQAATIEIERNAKQLTPVDTGRLRSSITPYSDGLGGQVSTNVDYAPSVEFGTGRQRAQPYLNPAYEETKPKYIQRVNEALKAAGRYERI